ncbi:MAG: hypothetical protein VX712_01345 [Bacteroidota bacterium]|uniref:Uncharacterized protein n=1 Tax=Christiangramia flava JLT2011 TaxID=1229726 RepID=A0A1L7I0M4_9FLAO|nr:hypothetical protein [Christiangramia flava]APU67150.1 hypothetical protein GRFL_0426 [Christiangramia flava JLT2011]MEE2770831.1 hypothetical protein [Bacteroidota bacterium]OSS38078.1 hypothetical protein C723_2977 [Christiangramia flava JLT2011]
MSLKKILIRKKIRKYARQSGFEETGITGRSALLIAEEFEERIPVFLSALKNAGFNPENLEIFVCNPTKFQGDHRSLSDSQVNMRGRFKDEQILESLAKPYDFLLCFFEENCYAGGLFTARAKAQLKIGRGWDALSLFNISIQTDDFREFWEEAFKYLKILKNTN